MVVGGVFVALGGVLFAAQLFGHGGWRKSQQFRVLGELHRGDHGGTARRLFWVSLVLMPVGACLLFASVAQSDRARAKRCEERCAADGFTSGRIGPNSDRVEGDARSRFVACICEADGRESVEHRADAL